MTQRPSESHAKPTGADSLRLGTFTAACRWAEMLGFFFVLPGVVALVVDPARRAEGAYRAVGLGFLFDLPFPAQRLLMPLLLLFTIGVVVWLLLDRSFDKRRLWDAAGLRRELRRMTLLFIPGAILMLAVAWNLDRFGDMPDGFQFLGLLRRAPIILLIIAVFYPWLSAYPQEITHRAFFFHRYAPILRSTPAMIAVNALAFMWLHAPFWSPEALLLTLPGGVLFAWTYSRSRSTLATTVEHAAYGWWAFFVGLGWFVFTGSIGR